MPTCIEGLVAGFRRLDLPDLHAAGVGGEPAEEGIAGLGHIGRQNGHGALGVGHRVEAANRAAVGDIGDVPRLDRGLTCGADDVRTVADTDALRDGGTVFKREGVVVGGQARGDHVAADGCILNILVGRDIAVDEDTCFLAGIVSDHDGLDEAVGILDLRRSAFHGDEAAEIALVFKVCGRDLLRLDRRFLAALFNAGHLDLAFALIGGRPAGDADLVADLELARDRERVDACGLVLHIDAVEERGILVIAGGVGGHDALHGKLDALLCLCLHIRDLGDLGLVEHGDEILADLVVGVVLLRTAVGDLVLHLEVRHEGCAGNNDHALACKLLGRHDHQAVIVFCEGVLRGSCAAEAVAVNVHRVGRCMAVDCRADRCGQRRGRVAVCVYCVDGRAAVVAEALGVELVKRMLFVEFHAVQKRVLHVVGREVESPLVDAVGCGADIVIRCVVRNAEAGAEFGQNLVLRRGHVLDVRVVLDDGVILVVVGPTGEDHHTAVVVERLEGVQLVLGIGLRILLGRFQTAGRGRQDECLVLGVFAGRDELLAGLQRDCTHGIGRSQFAEVAHGVLIVACNVFVVVRGVNADVDKLACVKHIERDVLGERVLLAVLLDHSRDLDRHDAGLGRGILEFHILRAACGQSDGIRHGADGFAADGIGDGLDGSGLCLTVEERGGDGQFFVGDRGRRAAFSLGNAKLERFADPDGSGHGQIAVALGDADEVIGVLRRQFHADGALGEIRGTVPGIGDLAGVDDQFDLGDGIGAVGIVEGDLEVQLLRNVDDGAHHVAVDRVVQLEVLVLGGVHTARSERCIDAVFGKVVGQDDVAGVVGVAPAALVVILVVGRGDVPALVERHDVLLVAGIIAACADLAFAVADFDHVHTGVNNSIPVTEVNEVAERRARMVELADGVGALCLRQELVVGLQASILGLVVERRVVAGDDAGGVEGVDMAGAAGPRHFKARNGDHAACIFRIERSDRVLIGLPGLLAVFRCFGHVVERALGVGCAGLVKVVGMVSECDEVDVRAFRQILDIIQCAFQRASAVGILRVGVQLAEVALEGRLADGEGPGLAGFLFIRTLDRHSHRDLAVRHIGSRGVGDLAVRVDSIDLFTVDSHRYAGVLASV